MPQASIAVSKCYRFFPGELSPHAPGRGKPWLSGHGQSQEAIEIDPKIALINHKEDELTFNHQLRHGRCDSPKSGGEKGSLRETTSSLWHLYSRKLLRMVAPKEQLQNSPTQHIKHHLHHLHHLHLYTSSISSTSPTSPT